MHVYLRSMLILQTSEQNKKWWLLEWQINISKYRNKHPQEIIWYHSPNDIEGVCTYMNIQPFLWVWSQDLFIYMIFSNFQPQNHREKMIWVNAWFIASHLWNIWERIYQSQLMAKGRIHTCSVGKELKILTEQNCTAIWRTKFKFKGQKPTINMEMYHLPC